MLRRKIVFGFKISIKVFGIFMTWKNSKYSATSIIDYNYSERIRDIIVPKRIAIIKKAQIAGNKIGLQLIGYRTTNGCGRTAVNTTGASLAKYFYGFVHVQQLCISNGTAIAYLQYLIIGTHFRKCIKYLDIRERDVFDKAIGFFCSF